MFLFLFSLFAFGLLEQALAELEAAPVALYNNSRLDLPVECLLLYATQRLNHATLLGYLVDATKRLI